MNVNLINSSATFLSVPWFIIRSDWFQSISQRKLCESLVYTMVTISRKSINSCINNHWIPSILYTSWVLQIKLSTNKLHIPRQTRELARTYFRWSSTKFPQIVNLGGINCGPNNNCDLKQIVPKSLTCHPLWSLKQHQRMSGTVAHYPAEYSDTRIIKMWIPEQS